MKKINALMLIAIAILFVYCKKPLDHSIEDLGDNNTQIASLDSNFINLNEAIRLAIKPNLVIESSGVSGKKNHAQKEVTVKKVKNYFIYSEAVNNATARAKDDNYKSSAEPLLYVVNYEGGGASIISSDKRFGEILATFDENTTITQGMEAPDGFVNFMEYASRTIKGIKEDRIKLSPGHLWSEKDYKSTGPKTDANHPANRSGGELDPECLYDYPDGWGNFPPPSSTCQTTYDVYRVNSGPHAKTLWGQGAGYNDLVPLACGSGKAPTGCVATAMAQALAIYKYPASYNWLSMNDYSGSAETARLMRDLGSMVNMTYACDGSGATMADANNAFRSLGINSLYVDDDDNRNNPNLDKYITQIENRISNRYDFVTGGFIPGSPIMAGGCKIVGKSGWWIFKRKYYSQCHAWLIDGYRYRRYCSTVRDPSTQYRYFIYEEKSYHFNFGWDGAFNGWYALNFAGPNGVVDPSINYLHGQDIIMDIHN